MSGSGPARRQVMLSIALGVLAGVPAVLALGWADGVLLAWDVASAAYLIWVWTTVWPLDADATARHAVRQDPTRAAADGLLLSAALASLVAVGFVLASAASGAGTNRLEVGLGVGSVALSWGLVHTIFALRYARDYYGGDVPGGVSFPGSAAPCFSDFAYLAFTIGMTFQVSDTALEDEVLRRDALRHALLSFVFGTGVLATTVNLVASLTSH